MHKIQILFNRAVLGVVAQGKPAINHDNGCSYRGEDGCKCAVGHLIADEHYKPALEGHTLYDPDVLSALLASNPDLNLTADEAKQAQRVLRELQSAHDNNWQSDEFVEDFLAGARRTAFMYDLEMPDA